MSPDYLTDLLDLTVTNLWKIPLILKGLTHFFYRFASWVCHAGKDYLESAMKLDKLKKGDKCEHGRD